jgi:quinol monooxygenase YgiN
MEIKQVAMKPVIIINRFAIKPGKMDEFIDAQQRFGAAIMKTSNGLLGGRMYRAPDGTSAVLVSVFASASAQDEIRQSEAFKAHVSRLQPMIESSTPSVYEEAYTAGEFR